MAAEDSGLGAMQKAFLQSGAAFRLTGYVGITDRINGVRLVAYDELLGNKGSV